MRLEQEEQDGDGCMFFFVSKGAVPAGRVSPLRSARVGNVSHTCRFAPRVELVQKKMLSKTKLDRECVNSGMRRVKSTECDQ